MQGLQQQQQHRQQPTGAADYNGGEMMDMNFEHHQSPSEMLMANLQRPRSQQSNVSAVDVQTATGSGTELDRYLKYMSQQPDSNHNYQQQQQQQQQHVMFAGIQQSHHHHHLQQQQQQQYNSYYAPAVQHVMQQDHNLQQQQQQQHHVPSSYLLNNCGVKSEFGGYASLDGLPPPPQHYPDVQNVPATTNMQSVAAAAAAAAAAGQVLAVSGKPDEEFSVILADVRKTCYSS